MTARWCYVTVLVLLVDEAVVQWCDIVNIAVLCNRVDVCITCTVGVTAFHVYAIFGSYSYEDVQDRRYL